MLTMIRDLNSTTKNFKIAQILLNALMRSQDLQWLMKSSKGFKNETKTKDEKSSLWDQGEKLSEFDKLLDVIQGSFLMQAYSEKHLLRQEQFIKRSYYLDFFLKQLNLV